MIESLVYNISYCKLDGYRPLSFFSLTCPAGSLKLILWIKWIVHLLDLFGWLLGILLDLNYLKLCPTTHVTWSYDMSQCMYLPIMSQVCSGWKCGGLAEHLCPLYSCSSNFIALWLLTPHLFTFRLLDLYLEWLKSLNQTPTIKSH